MTRMIRSAIFGAAMIGLAVSPGAMAREKLSGEEQLAKLLDGRVAGEPQRCISRQDSEQMKVINDTALVYGRGKTIYVNRTKHPSDIDDDDIQIVKKYGSAQLCRLDNVSTMDRTGHFYTGNIFLDDFIPYTKVDDKE